jgi:hypothetical protein
MQPIEQLATTDSRPSELIQKINELVVAVNKINDELEDLAQLTVADER